MTNGFFVYFPPGCEISMSWGVQMFWGGRFQFVELPLKYLAPPDARGWREAFYSCDKSDIAHFENGGRA